ncbi:MAG: hypothetical protein J2P44_05170 [Candidatus Dormibacteraeota bacterium]|nr:hypothetical protein [Candidatus Dormibacteraeota bacterium]
MAVVRFFDENLTWLKRVLEVLVLDGDSYRLREAKGLQPPIDRSLRLNLRKPT